MTEKQIVKADGKGGRPVLDIAMSALAGFSVGFAAFAMPADMFAGLFGTAPRLPVVGAAAVLTFIAVVALLRALEPGGRRRSAEVPAEPPRLRRADAHPDAPARWPIFARHELGTPLPAEQPAVEEMETAEVPASPEIVEAVEEVEVAEAPALPEAIEAEPEGEAEAQPVAELEAEQPVIEDIVDEEADVLELERPLSGLLASQIEIAEGEPVERVEVEAEPDRPMPSFIAPEVAAEEAVDEPEAEPEIVEAAVEPEEERIEPVAEEPAVAEAPAPAIEEEFVAASPEEPIAEPVEEPVAEAEEQPIAAQEPAVVEEEVAAVPQEPIQAAEETPAVGIAEESAPPPVAGEPIEALAARLPDLPESRDETISDLMGRLETGLGRRDRARWLGDDENAPSVAAPTDERLRSAIGVLRRMAGRKG